MGSTKLWLLRSGTILKFMVRNHPPVRSHLHQTVNCVKILFSTKCKIITTWERNTQIPGERTNWHQLPVYKMKKHPKLPQRNWQRLLQLGNRFVGGSFHRFKYQFLGIVKGEMNFKYISTVEVAHYSKKTMFSNSFCKQSTKDWKNITPTHLQPKSTLLQYCIFSTSKF